MPAVAALFMEHGAAGGLDPATTAWAAQVVTNGGSVSAGRKTTVNNLITGLKSDGVWTKLDRLWLYAAENTPSALTDLVGLVLAVNISACAFTTDRGYTGNSGAGAYIDTGFNPGVGGPYNFVLNSAHLSAWQNTAGASDGPLLGDRVSTLNRLYPFSGAFYFGVNNAPGDNTPDTPTQTLYLASRTGSGTTGVTVYKAGASFATGATASSAVSTSTIDVLRELGSGAASNRQICEVSFGGGLSSTDVANFYNRLRTYMTAVGVP